MKLIPHNLVNLKSGFFFNKQELNRKVTIHAVYDRFTETGRIGAFKFGFPEKDPIQPHFFWDSDVAKWMEGDYETSRRMQFEAIELIDALFCEVNPIPVKKAMNLMGMEVGPLRAPLTEMEEATTARLEKAMKAYGLL